MFSILAYMISILLSSCHNYPLVDSTERNKEWRVQDSFSSHQKHNNTTKVYKFSPRSVRTAYLERYLVRHFSGVSYKMYRKSSIKPPSLISPLSNKPPSLLSLPFQAKVANKPPSLLSPSSLASDAKERKH